MNRNTSSIHRIVALIVFGLVAVPVWAETSKSRASTRAEEVRANDRRQQAEVALDSLHGQVRVRVSPRHLNGINVPFPLRERLTVLKAA